MAQRQCRERSAPAAAKSCGCLIVHPSPKPSQLPGPTHSILGQPLPGRRLSRGTQRWPSPRVEPGGVAAATAGTYSSGTAEAAQTSDGSRPATARSWHTPRVHTGPRGSAVWLHCQVEVTGWGSDQLRGSRWACTEAAPEWSMGSKYVHLNRQWVRGSSDLCLRLT